jgi:hypothetical protein
MESEVRLSHERSLRDAGVLVIGYRGLKPTANHERSLRDASVLVIAYRGLKPTAIHERSLRDATCVGDRIPWVETHG